MEAYLGAHLFNLGVDTRSLLGALKDRGDAGNVVWSRGVWFVRGWVRVLGLLFFGTGGVVVQAVEDLLVDGGVDVAHGAA